MTNPLAGVHYGQPLADRERQVLDGIANGLTTNEIAARLFLSFHTVKTYTTRAFIRLGARDRAHAVALATVTRQLDISAVQATRPERPTERATA